MEIKRLQRDDLVEAMKLTERVFMEFDAPDYSPEGTKNFLEFIYIDNIYTIPSRIALTAACVLSSTTSF